MRRCPSHLVPDAAQGDRTNFGPGSGRWTVPGGLARSRRSNEQRIGPFVSGFGCGRQDIHDAFLRFLQSVVIVIQNASGPFYIELSSVPSRQGREGSIQWWRRRYIPLKRCIRSGAATPGPFLLGFLRQVLLGQFSRYSSTSTGFVLFPNSFLMALSCWRR